MEGKWSLTCTGRGKDCGPEKSHSLSQIRVPLVTKIYREPEKGRTSFYCSYWPGPGSISPTPRFCVSGCELFSGSSVRELHKSFSISYVYDYVTKLSRKQAEVVQNHENSNVRNIGQGEARHSKYKRLKLGGGQAYDRSSD
jgi:hypothetical protein